MLSNNKTTEVLDIFIQFMQSNVFVYLGADDVNTNNKENRNELKIIQPRISVVQVEER